jgi:hypothetical protein
MKFPHVVASDLSDRHVERYRRHIDSDASGWHRRFTESIWRRHQHPSNARLSGWRGDADRKRRLVHFYDEYGLEGRAFVLRNGYLHLNLTLPAGDVEEYLARIDGGLADGDWRRAEGGARAGAQAWRRGDLRAELRHARRHEQDERRGNALPEHYANLDVVVRTEGYALPDAWDERPWNVFFNVGLRKTLARGAPRLIQPEDIAEYLPAQVELGCGPSIEAGIPHLSTLHRIYGVSHADYGFVYRAADDGLLALFRDPEAKYREMTDIYRACLVATATPFYDRLTDLWRRGHLVGPIITNNFDCQCADLGLPEISLRRYDWEPYYPRIEHDPRARSLLVIGVHADRRLVQMRARERGLKVVYIDPETYVAPDGRDISYPVEAPQSEDAFCRTTAHEAFRRLHAALAD